MLLLSHMIQEPDIWDEHLRRSAASTVLAAVYGWPPLDKSADPLVERINDLMHRLVRACLPGAHMVEIFPWMLHFPDWMAKWKREAKGWFKKDTKMFEGFMDDVRTKMVTVFS